MSLFGVVAVLACRLFLSQFWICYHFGFVTVLDLAQFYLALVTDIIISHSHCRDVSVSD